MKEFWQLVIGSSFLALVAFVSWSIGALMGFGVGRATGRPGRARSDVDELLANQRASARTAGRVPPPASVG